MEEPAKTKSGAQRPPLLTDPNVSDEQTFFYFLLPRTLEHSLPLFLSIARLQKSLGSLDSQLTRYGSRDTTGPQPPTAYHGHAFVCGVQRHHLPHLWSLPVRRCRASPECNPLANICPQCHGNWYRLETAQPGQDGLFVQQRHSDWSELAPCLLRAYSQAAHQPRRTKSCLLTRFEQPSLLLSTSSPLVSKAHQHLHSSNFLPSGAVAARLPPDFSLPSHGSTTSAGRLISSTETRRREYIFLMQVRTLLLKNLLRLLDSSGNIVVGEESLRWRGANREMACIFQSGRGSLIRGLLPTNNILCEKRGCGSLRVLSRATGGIQPMRTHGRCRL